jgi:CHAT domain-containing protein
VPDVVVLSGCETARTGTAGPEGFGLAQAFAVAGAREVIAAIRPVRDEVSLAVAKALYAAFARQTVDRPNALDAEEALRDAQLELGNAGHGRFAFRVIRR